MDLKSTIAIILKDLEDARNILDDMKKYPDVPAIQIELAKAKCRSAEDVIKVLAEENLREGERESGRRGEKVEEKKKVEEKVKEEVEKVEEVEEEVEKVEEVEEKVEEVEEEVEEVEKVEKVELEVEEKFEIEETVIDEVVQPKAEKTEQKSDDPKKSQIIADKFSKQSSINESMGSLRHDEETAELSKIKPVYELTKAIGINERFMFIRELFNGDQELYKSTVDQLNNTDNIDSAFGILAQAAPDATGDETFDQLLDLVKRKLATE